MNRLGLSAFVAFVLVSVALLFSSQPALAQFTQQGPKLVGTGAVGTAEQGCSVALSADGNTAIVGGPDDNSGTGAAWVYTRSGGVWTQQGSKLVGTGAVGTRLARHSVALSADGNTAIVGGFGDNSNTGAAWVFTRSGGVWTQQGSKLVGTGAVGAADQGSSVALSADGNTAIVGGPTDNSRSRGGVGLHPQRRCLDPAGQQAGRHRRGWSRLPRLSPSRCPPTATPPSWAGLTTTRAPGRRGSSPAAAVSGPSKAASWSAPARLDSVQQGCSVALSADGNTAIVGGSGDNSNARGGVGLHPQRRCLDPAGQQAGRHRCGWNRRAKAAPSRCPPTATPPSWAGMATTRAPGRRGSSPAAAASGPSRERSWSAPARLEPPSQGYSVALSADGNTAIVGGLDDNSDIGAAWVFVQPSLQVTPATNMVAAGNPGGPFAPSSFQYQLSATVGSINYSISGVPNWLTPSSTSGIGVDRNHRDVHGQCKCK